MLASNQWWNFVPYTICVDKCPEKFTIVDSTKYGGCNYAGVEAGSGACKEADHPTYYAAFKTKQMLRRCFPVLEKADADERTLCAVPDCTAAGKACVNVPGEPAGTPSGAT